MGRSVAASQGGSMKTRAGAAIVVAGTVLFGLAYAAPGDSVRPLTDDDYSAAMALFEPNLRGLVKNESVQPHWLDDDGSFWYRRDTDEGHAYVLFDLGSRPRSFQGYIRSGSHDADGGVDRRGGLERAHRHVQPRRDVL